MMTRMDIYVSSTNDETGFLACNECGEEFLSDAPGDDVPERMPAGQLVMALVAHQVKHVMVDDVTAPRRARAAAVDAALAQLRQVIADTGGS